MKHPGSGRARPCAEIAPSIRSASKESVITLRGDTQLLLPFERLEVRPGAALALGVAALVASGGRRKRELGAVLAAAMLVGFAAVPASSTLAQSTALHTPGVAAANASSRESDPALDLLRGIASQADSLWQAAVEADWIRAKAALEGLKRSVRALRDGRFEGAYARDGGRMAALYGVRHRLDTTILEAEIAIAAQTAPSLMLYANRLTLDAADLTGEIAPTLDREAATFGFLARELDYARATGNAALYTETRAEIDNVWAHMRPRVVGRGGERSAARVDLMLAKLSESSHGDRAAIATLVAESNALRAAVSGHE
jgi:hypothetical protein